MKQRLRRPPRLRPDRVTGVQGYGSRNVRRYLRRRKTGVDNVRQRWDSRTLDALGFVRFLHWRICGEHVLAGKRAPIWLYGETLLLEFSDEPLTQYSVEYEPDQRNLRGILPRQLFRTEYRSPQLPLWEFGDREWLQDVRLPTYKREVKRCSAATQANLSL